MYADIINFVLIPALTAVFDWFNSVFLAFGGVKDFYLAIFFVVCSYRFILAPLFRGVKAGSDRVKRTKNDSSSDRQSDNMEG